MAHRTLSVENQARTACQMQGRLFESMVSIRPRGRGEPTSGSASTCAVIAAFHGGEATPAEPGGW